MKKTVIFFIVALMIMTLSSCVIDTGEIKNGIDSIVSPKVAEDFVRGTVDGNTYINEYMNIKMELPESYYFLSDDEMKDIFGVSELYEDGAIVAYDAFARNNESASVNIVYQLSAVSADVYLDMITAELSTGNTGATLELCERGTVKAGENELPCVNIEISQNDYEGNSITTYETIAVKEKGSWIGVITAGSIKQSDIDTIFSKIEI